MSSLEVINKTLHGIREDTDELNRNFLKFFLEQQRGKLDAEEDRRERAKMMAALGAAAAGARAGGSGGQGQSDGLGLNPLKLITDLIKKYPWLAAALGIPVIKAGVSVARGTYRVARTTAKVATAPARLGNFLGEKTVERARVMKEKAAAKAAERAAAKAAADELERLKKQAFMNMNEPDSTAAGDKERARRIRRERLRLQMINASQGFGDVEAMADVEAEKARARARSLQAQRGFVPGSTAQSAARYSTLELEEIKRLQGQRGFVPGSTAQTANKALKMPYRPFMPTGGFGNTQAGSIPGAKDFLPTPRGTSYTPSSSMGGSTAGDSLPKVSIVGNKVSYLDPVSNKFLPHKIAIETLERNGFSALGEDLRADLEEVRRAEQERIKQAKAVAERAKTPNTPAKTLDQIVTEARAERARVAANIAKKAGGTIKATGFGALAAAGKASPILWGFDAGLKAKELQDEGVTIGASSPVALATSATLGLGDFANWIANFGLRAVGSDYQLRTDMASSTNKGIFNFLRNNIEYVPPEFRKFLFKKEELDKLNKPYVPNKVVPMDSSLMIPQVSAEEEANAKALAAAEAQFAAARLLENAAIAMGKNSDGRIVTKGGSAQALPMGSTVDLRANKLNMMVGGGGMFMIPDMIMPTI